VPLVDTQRGADAIEVHLPPVAQYVALELENDLRKTNASSYAQGNGYGGRRRRCPALIWRVSGRGLPRGPGARWRWDARKPTTCELLPAMQKMVDQLGGLGKLVKGKTVAIKINLTGAAQTAGTLPTETPTTPIPCGAGHGVSPGEAGAARHPILKAP